ncbi:MAG: InlB B-repeat-containing protein [Clostridia bacterium]|nr:InlB B-repeat-containing protein [Clostridia bacterium]
MKIGDLIVEEYYPHGHVCIFYGLDNNSNVVIVDQNTEDQYGNRYRYPRNRVWWNPFQNPTRIYRPNRTTVNKPAAPSVTVSSSNLYKGEEITLSWNAVSGASSYYVRIYNSDGTLISEKSIGNVTSWSYSSFEPGDYTLYVIAANSAGSSASKAIKISVKSAVKVRVLFDAQGGKVDTSEKTVDYKGTYGSLPVPERKEYRFLGWSLKASGTTYVNKNTTVNTQNDHTLYAIWDGPGEWGEWSAWSTTAVSETSYRQVETKSEASYYNMITYCCGNSSGQRCYLAYMQDGYTLRTGEPYEETWSVSQFKSATKYSQGSFFDFYDGTAVDGYIIGPGDAYVASDGYLPFFVSSTDSRTLYRSREWKNYTLYTVSFYTNDGTQMVPKTTRTVKSGETVSDIPTVKRDGYEFLGWFTQKTGGEKLTSSTRITSNRSYYAHWKESCDGENHRFGEWKTIKEPSCTVDGEEERVCTVCGYTETNVLYARHKPGAVRISAEKHWYICDVCGEQFGVESHIYDESRLIQSTASGERDKMECTCKVCGYTGIFIIGDCNNDIVVDNKDVVTLFRYVSSDNVVYSAIYDLNTDKEVNNKDVASLFRSVSAN